MRLDVWDSKVQRESGTASKCLVISDKPGCKLESGIASQKLVGRLLTLKMFA
jgi:hypothetical protein